jgi:hypothetical protein
VVAESPAVKPDPSSRAFLGSPARMVRLWLVWSTASVVLIATTWGSAHLFLAMGLAPLFRSPALLADRQYDLYGGVAFVDAFDRPSMCLAALLIIASHVVPLCIPRRRTLPRTILRFLDTRSYREVAPAEQVIMNVAALRDASSARLELAGIWAVALSSCVALISMASGWRAVCFHGECRYSNPAEVCAYLAVAMVCLMSHAPRVVHLALFCMYHPTRTEACAREYRMAAG